MPTFQERWYQNECVEAMYADAIADATCNPVGVIPTGAGKTIIICKLIDKILSNNPYKNILILSHNKRILKQNHESISRYFQQIQIGLYSSGLKSRVVKKITVAGIQSIYRKRAEFSIFDTIIIDECHLVTVRQSGMYRVFLDALPDAQVSGLTATHFRTDHGYIHIGEEALFNKISYDLSSTKNYNRLVSEGYLSELFAKPTALKMETSGLKKIAGDFSSSDMSIKLDRKEITEAAVIESVYFGKKYKKWLCFAIDIEHANHIKESFLRHGISSEVLHSQIEGDEADIIKRYKNNEYRLLISVDMLTTGFDNPEIDFILLMRPTQSPVVHVQTIGRGGRVVYADGFAIGSIEERLLAIESGPKQHCLVMDFAGNVARLGPVNQVEIKQKGKKKGGAAVTKECPECQIINHGAARFCCNCEHEFIFKEKLLAVADESEIIIKDFIVDNNAKTWVDVHNINFMRHKSQRGFPDSICVSYYCGKSIIKDYVCLDHIGYPYKKAKNWIDFRWDLKNGIAPTSVAGAIQKQKLFKKTRRILVDTRGQFPQVLDAKF